MSVGSARAPSGTPATRRGVLGGGAWVLGRISGIELAIDHSWILIFALITFSLRTQLAQEHETWSLLQQWSSALATSLLFFASIVIHEFGHSLTAQRLGVRVRSITLFVFGGVAQLESEPKRPRDEIVIAIAGPLASVALGFGFGALASALAAGVDPAAEMGSLEAMTRWLSRINFVLVAFNAVPGLPLDGGRVLRGVVWALTGSFERATSVAATSGTLVAYALIFLGIASALGSGQWVGGLWLVFIGWFLLSAARSSVGQLVIERVLSGVRSGDIAESHTETLISGAETVAALVAETVLRRGIRTLYVVDAAGRLAGLVTLRELAGVPSAERPTTRAMEVMVPSGSLAVLHPEESAWVAMKRMAERGVNQLPVVVDGRLLGSVTRERLLTVVQAGLTPESRAGR